MEQHCPLCGSGRPAGEQGTRAGAANRAERTLQSGRAMHGYLMRLLSAFALLLLIGTTAAAQPGPAIKLKSRVFTPPADVDTVTARQGRAARAAARRAIGPDRRAHFIVQFEGPITSQDLAELRQAGATPLRYVPDFALAVAAPLDFEPSSLRRARWAGELLPADRVSPEAAVELQLEQPRFPLMFVVFQPDVTSEEVAASLAHAGTSAVPRPGLPGHLALVPADRSAIEQLAADDLVAWIYPARSDEAASSAPVCQGVLSSQGIVAEYATVGDGWDGPGRGAADLGFYVQAFTAQVSSATTHFQITRALEEWAQHIQITWKAAASPQAPRALNILWATGEHGDGYPFPPDVLAHAFYHAPVTPEPLAGDVHFNDAFKWSATGSSGYDIFSVMLHEAGHSLGLGHSSHPADVMYAVYQGVVTGLAPGDIAAARQLYAATGGVPAGWVGDAIGAGVTAIATESGGVFELEASGRDVWGTADEFGFVYRVLAGDGDIVARVDSLAAVDRWTKAGVMIRASTSPGAPHAFMIVSSEKGLAFQRRRVAGGISYHTDGGAGTAPHWVWLSRKGNRFDAYAAVDGGAWRLIGSDTITMPGSVLVGLALNGHNGTAVARAAFSNVLVTQAPSWHNGDIGAVGRAGSFSVAGTTLTVRGAGADVWDTADAFHFAWRELKGDGQIVARVASVQNTDKWAKAGVMIRAGLHPGAAHAFMLVSPGKGYAFQRRRVQGEISHHTAGGTGTAPQWVRLTRQGSTIKAYRSTDGTNWLLVGSDTIPMGQTVLIGVAVTSHTTAALCQAVFEGVALIPHP